MRWTLVLALLGACFSTPQERCGFLCGPANECPPDYACVAGDNRCHLVENGSPVACTETDVDAPMPVVDAPPEVDAPPGTPDAPPMIDAPPPMIDAPPPMIDAPPPMIDAPPPPIDAPPDIDAP